MEPGIREYLRKVERTLAAGNATEHSYRPAFQALVESFEKGTSATNEPRRVACGAPDFIVSHQTVPIGYIECKDIGVSLDEAEASEQLGRYRENLENLILTDYLQFRYYVAGQPEMHVLLARLDAKGKPKMLQGADAQLTALFGAFLAAQTKTIATPKELAARLANLAKIIRDAITRAFEIEAETGTLHGELESFRATILKDITPQQFADMYAQTVCYGMFSARVNVPDREAAKFTREYAAYDLPATNPFLREVFDYIAGTRLDTSIVWAVDLLAEILRRCDIGAILKDFGKAVHKEDPVVHFYETFLAAYDPALRETRGVYYTPEPVVSFIVRSIDRILKAQFGCSDGLADCAKVTLNTRGPSDSKGSVPEQVHRVQILDPAAGTGTFLYETVRQIYDATKASRGTWPGPQGYVAQHLLPRLYGFELMMAPYAVAHLKLSWLLNETGYNFPPGERLRVYLTNTLEEAEIVAGVLLALANQIAQEANAASKVKTECPIMVVMGNPPYSGLSANMNPWADRLLKKPLPTSARTHGYYEVDGQPLGERKLWLQDDYVKFIRFAQYRIELTGYGVLGFITNHGYLDNPTFRGMRQSLMRTFDEIFVLDLHGSTKKKEKPPADGKDENVFDIQQGVAIGLFVKRGSGQPKAPARISHAELWGTRDDKYAWLFANDVQTTNWRPLSPNSPHYFFVPRNETARQEYEACRCVTDVFAQHIAGITTARDHFAVDFNRDTLLARMADFASRRESPQDLLQSFGLRENYAWRVADAQMQLQNAFLSVPKEKYVQRLLYRPFDERFIFYHPAVVWRTRSNLMPTMLCNQNRALCISRSVEIGRGWEHAFCSRLMVQHHTASLKEVNYLFPLYLYPAGTKGFGPASRWPPAEDGRRPNIMPDFAQALSEKVKLAFLPDGAGDFKTAFGPEDVLHYIYAVLHSPTYRRRYAEFLKIDFPRIPFTTDAVLFGRLCSLGAELVALHTLECAPPRAATYAQAGDNVVHQPRYKPPTTQAPGRIYINNAQYFESIPPEVWQFHVGGYQVCERWLKDRKGQCLSYDDIETYRKITEAICQTIRLMAEIDASIPSWPLT